MDNISVVLSDFVSSAMGKTVVALLAVLLLVMAVGFVSSKRQFNTKMLVYSAVAVALGTVLSFVKLSHLPFGGSTTLFSMMIIVLVGYWFGPVQGILTGLTYGLIQLVVEPYVIHPVQLIVDYLLAFSMLGLSGFFRKGKYSLIIGFLVAVFGRFVFACISGVVFFGEYAAEMGYESEILYSIVYNSSYLVPEAIITVALLLIPAVRNAINQVGKSVYN